MRDVIRRLASSIDQQILYSRMKDGMAIELFINKRDFTSIQMEYLYWLEIYHGLYMSLSDDKYLNNEVIKHPIRCDAYLYFKNKTKNEEKKEVKINNKFNKKRKKGVPVPGIPTICFKQKGE